jgi:hypothetical protein
MYAPVLSKKSLLLFDCLINIILGLILILFPFGTAKLFGAPAFASYFYPMILGAVLIGIGIALLIEVYGKPFGIHGIGVAGAITINFFGASALALLLVYGDLQLQFYGYVGLWIIVVLVLGIGIIELLSRTWIEKKVE